MSVHYLVDHVRGHVPASDPAVDILIAGIIAKIRYDAPSVACADSAILQVLARLGRDLERHMGAEGSL
jgi:hypothetical protein